MILKKNAARTQAGGVLENEYLKSTMRLIGHRSIPRCWPPSSHFDSHSYNMHLTRASKYKPDPSDILYRQTKLSHDPKSLYTAKNDPDSQKLPVHFPNQDMIQSLLLTRTMATTVSQVRVEGKAGHIGYRSSRGYGNLFIDCVDLVNTHHGGFSDVFLLFEVVRL